MKKSCLKKTAVLTMAAAMTLSMAGCGGSKAPAEGSGAEAEGQSQAASQGQAQSQSQAQGSGELPTITFMTTDFTGTALKNEYSDQVIEKYETYTGIHVDWRWEANDTYTEKLGLTLMDKDNMPMVLTSTGNLTANIVDAAKKGAFWDLTPFLQDAESFPNLSQANPDVLKGLTVDGQIIGLYRGRELGRYGLSYRTDWAEKVGITEDPKTPEDVYSMMYKFTYEDPDGNGKDDTYGLELCKYTGPLDIIQTWFGCGNEWMEKDGKLVPVHQTEEFMEALKWMRKAYEEGLVRKDWATVDSGTFQDSCKKGEAGIFIDVMDGGKRIWKYFEDNDVKSVVNPDEFASMTLVGPINNRTLATSGYNGFYLITKAGAKTEEDVRNCLTFLDKLGDTEMMILSDYGLEGITWDFNEKGEIVPKEGFKAEEVPQAGLSQAQCYIPNLASVDPHRIRDKFLQAQEDIQAVCRKVAVTNPALGYLANSEVNAEVGTDIEQIIDDARTQYICGQIDDAGFEAAAKQWADRGGDRLIEEINQLYQADSSK